MKRVIIIGAGGFGREALDVLRAVDPQQELWDFVGFVSNERPDQGLLDRIGATWLGSDEKFLGGPVATHFVAGIGAPAVRRAVVGVYEAAGIEPVTLIHPSATVGGDVQLGAGTIMCAHSSVTTNVRVGRYVHIDRVATVGHDSQLDDFVTVHPGAVISGNVRIGHGTRLGSASCILPGVEVGTMVTVGAGAVVTRSVGDGETVVGVPARPLR